MTLYAAIIWACYAAVFYFVFHAFGFTSTYQLTWITSLVLLVVTTISVINGQTQRAIVSRYAVMYNFSYVHRNRYNTWWNLLVYRLIFSSNQKILNFQGFWCFLPSALLATSMRSEGTKSRPSAVFCASRRVILDFVRSEAYLSRSTAEAKQARNKE